ncbi:MAG TPA: hypothetical protein VED46_18475 [Alphaproteobacteria bacterium]|nr:hypothetical protein [Alphaproteobacteria bacterium]
MPVGSAICRTFAALAHSWVTSLAFHRNFTNMRSADAPLDAAPIGRPASGFDHRLLDADDSQISVRNLAQIDMFMSENLVGRAKGA